MFSIPWLHIGTFCHQPVLQQYQKYSYLYEMAATISEVIDLIPDWIGELISIEPLSGGITNRNYKIVVGGSLYFVSILGCDSQLLGIDWHNKVYNAKICSDAGLSPQVIHHFSEQKALVLEYLPLPLCTSESLHSHDVQRRLVHSLKVLHAGSRFLVDFDMVSLIKSYMGIIKDWELDFLDGFRDCTKLIWEIGEALAPYREHLVPCHNDLVPENLIDDGKRVFMLDFDYSGNNDPCFDLGSISLEANFSNTQIRELARAYFGQVSDKILARIHLHSILGDVGWSLWSQIQAEISEIEFDFDGYGTVRWYRTREKLESSQIDKSLRRLR